MTSTPPAVSRGAAAAATTATVVGIMAYNEAENIERALRSVLSQTIADRITRVIVVASGCTDATPDIVARLAAVEPRIILLREDDRCGKIRAINTFLAEIDEPLVVMASADLIMEPSTLAALVAPLEDPAVGMVGAHPVPTNPRDTFVGFAVHLMWELHHRVSLRTPKMGELVAFRNILAPLDPAVLADEVEVERQIRAANFEIRYAPDAHVYNRGPAALSEFVEQRARWTAFNMHIARRFHIGVATLSSANLARAAFSYVRDERPRLDWLAAAALLELWARTRAYAMVLTRLVQRHAVWQPLKSTKRVGRGPR